MSDMVKDAVEVEEWNNMSWKEKLLVYSCATFFGVIMALILWFGLQK